MSRLFRLELEGAGAGAAGRESGCHAALQQSGNNYPLTGSRSIAGRSADQLSKPLLHAIIFIFRTAAYTCFVKFAVGNERPPDEHY
jgi:hypothetical protein